MVTLGLQRNLRSLLKARGRWKERGERRKKRRKEREAPFFVVGDRRRKRGDEEWLAIVGSTVLDWNQQRREIRWNKNTVLWL